jgi:hypothetical protein
MGRCLAFAALDGDGKVREVQSNAGKGVTSGQLYSYSMSASDIGLDDIEIMI